VASEAALFRQALWDEKGHNERLRVTFVDNAPEETIPVRLRAWHRFRPFEAGHELDQLISWIAARLGLRDVKSPTVRWPDAVPDFQPDLANRHLHEWPAIREMLAGQSAKRVLLLEAESGYGKSELLHQAIAYAQRLGIPVGRLDFRAGYAGVADLLGQLSVDLGEHLPEFAREGGNKTHLLIKDLRALRRPVLLVLDTYDKSTGVLRDWVSQSLLAEIERALAVGVIVAGQPPSPTSPGLPDAGDVRWRTVTRHLPLGAITDASHWKAWIERRYPVCLERHVDLATLVMASGGVPRTFADLCRNIAGQPARPNF
jgi:hypothetical protein